MNTWCKLETTPHFSPVQENIVLYLKGSDRTIIIAATGCNQHKNVYNKHKSLVFCHDRNKQVFIFLNRKISILIILLYIS